MASGTGAGFDKRTLRERCSEYVRDQVVAGIIRPGEHLVETRLSAEIGVSRGTLREALRPLEQEGLLVSDGRGHMLVRQLSSHEVLEVFEVRAALEALAMTKVLARVDRHEIITDLYAALEPLRDPDLPFATQIEADLDFHALLCEYSTNQTLVESWHRLLGQIKMIIVAAGPRAGSDRMRYDQHKVIVDAIVAGDADEARTILLAHFDTFAGHYVGDAVVRELGGQS